MRGGGGRGGRGSRGGGSSENQGGGGGRVPLSHSGWSAGLSLGALLGERARGSERERKIERGSFLLWGRVWATERASERERERGSLSGCFWMASGGSSQVLWFDRRPSCNPALPTNAYYCIVRPAPGSNPITPGTAHSYPPAPFTPFASAKG